MIYNFFDPFFIEMAIVIKIMYQGTYDLRGFDE